MKFDFDSLILKSPFYTEGHQQWREWTVRPFVEKEIIPFINEWEKNNWITADKKNVKNIDLWKNLKGLVDLNKVEWHWVKAHSENPMNALADSLAKKATPI